MGDTPWPGGVSPAQPRQHSAILVLEIIYLDDYLSQGKFNKELTTNLGIELQLHMGMDQS